MNNHRSDTRISNTVPTITHNETNKDKSMTTNNENNATNPGKKRRLSNSEETKTRGYPKRSMEVEQVDAKTFLFRSPAPLEEIDAIAAKMKSQIDAAQKEISEMGIEAYRKLKSGRERGKGDNDGGVDTDDELMQDEKRREEAIALEEAVVRGNPRRYQTALVELAKKQNTIVNLGTGQGKTLIALLLIRHFAGAYEEGKQTLFLVPSVALATQHTTTLQANLPYTVAAAYNNSTKANGAREAMAKANILVATHGAARDLFMHYGELFSFERINLLIVDECHYASGEHGYTTIMRNFYHKLPKKLRPRVLGLTASPLVNIKVDVEEAKLGEMLQQLEERLDSRLACLAKLGIGDEYNRKEAEERCVHYHRSFGLPSFPDHTNIGLHDSRCREFNQLVDLYLDLGPKLTSIYSATVAREISMNRYDEETKEEFLLAKKYLEYISEFCAEKCKTCPTGGKTEKLAVLEQLLEDIIESKGAENTVGVVFVDRRITALALYDYFRSRTKEIANGTWIRVKDTPFNRLIDTESRDDWFAPNALKTSGQNRFDLSSQQFQEMNFSKDELDAEIMNDVLESALPEGVSMKDLLDLEPSPMDHDVHIGDNDDGDTKHRTIRCDMIVRQATSVFKYLDRSHHYADDKIDDNWMHKIRGVKEVLDGLRTKRTNVLIATSVVEEGVDVDACSFVIVFDHIKSTKAYVQMKGRARQYNARFFVFHDTSPANMCSSYMHLQAAQTSDLRIKKFIETRSSQFPIPLIDPVVQFRPYTGESIHAEHDALIRGEYRTKKAMVDLSSAKTLLNRYTLSVPLEASSRTSRDLMGIHLPQFEETRLMLPSHIPSSARCVNLPERYISCTKKEKHNVLSLMACVRLHKLNLLNDRLLPLKRRDMQEKLIGVALTELATSEKSAPQKCPPMHNESSIVYIYKLQQTGKLFDQNDRVLGSDGRSLCLVTLIPLRMEQTSMAFPHVELGDINVCIKDPISREMDKDSWEWCTRFHTVLMNARWRRRTGSAFFIYNTDKVRNGILPPFVVGCLTKDDQMDLARIRQTVHDYGRSDSERTAAAKASDCYSDLKAPRIWCPLYDQHVSYIAHGPSELKAEAPFPDTSADIKTYSDYFNIRSLHKVSASSQLFAVQRQWHLPRRIPKKVSPTLFDTWKKKLETELDVPDAVLHDGERNPCQGLVAALMPIDVCTEAPIADASLFLHCLILPQILFHTERLMTTQLFIDHCSENLPILGSYLKIISKDCFEDIIESLSAKSSGMARNYDRLEYLGDAVLKLIHTDALLHSTALRNWVSHLHEGDLSVLRSAMGSNQRLMHATKSARLDLYILHKQLGRSQWAPAGLELHEITDDGTERLANTEEEKPGKKTLADIIESILGLIYLKMDFQAAYDVAKELGITLPRDPDYDSSIPGYKPDTKLAKVYSEILGGVRFKHPELLEEALTHPSCTHEEVPCYQKLEWVGDAVLCLFARNWIYHQYPGLKVGELVIMEATIVCNETLAYLSASNGLQRFLNHRDISLPGKFEEFERDCNDRGLWATDPPKCLSDIVEAVFGAVFVDSGLDKAFGVVDHMMKPVLNALQVALKGMAVDDVTSKISRGMIHPKQFVHELAGGILNVKSWKEEVFAITKPNCPIWKGGGIWGQAERHGTAHIGLIESLGIDIIGIEERSAHIARNRACAIAMLVFETHPDLIETLQSFSQVLRDGTVDKEERDADN